METKVQKQIIDYFSTFEEFHNTSKACLKACQNCAISINKLVRRCNNIKHAELSGTPLDRFDDLQNRLSTALNNLISEEIQEIRNQALIIEPLFEKLCHKCNILKDNCRDIDFTELTPLVRGTPLQPPLKQVLQFVDDSVTYGSLFGALIESTLNIFALKGSNNRGPSEDELTVRRAGGVWSEDKAAEMALRHIEMAETSSLRK
ncbi:unnamed protein product, partial [Iphiclides podalirius]